MFHVSLVANPVWSATTVAGAYGDRDRGQDDGRGLGGVTFWSTTTAGSDVAVARSSL